jgi:DNA polymerase III subunit delta'
VDFLSADSLPWLHSAQQRLRAAHAAQRLPHSLLLLSAPGLGAEQLASWITALALCESPGPRPCGTCASCQLLRADSHPDSYVVRLEEDARQIKVDQVRGLIESLTLKSYRGGYKVGVIEGAESLNANGANACRRPSPAAVCD